jgi:hypothetical protein
MNAFMNRLLILLAGAIVLVDAIWAAAGHFRIEVWPYELLGLLMLPLLGGAVFYARVRRDFALSSLLGCTAFVLMFSAATGLLNYLLITIAGPRIDDVLLAADKSIGVNWPAIMTFAAYHSRVTHMLLLIYVSVIAQNALLFIVLAWRQKCGEIYGFSLAIAIGALITLAVWTLFPSFGAFSVYDLPADVAGKLGLALTGDYGHDLVRMLKEGPGTISPRDLRGLVGFPSFHTVQALTLAWYARSLPYLRWPAVILNLLVIVSAPIHGGHDVVDLFGGAAVAVISIAAADRIVAFAARQQTETASVILPIQPQSTGAA